MNFAAGDLQTTVSSDNKYQIKGIQAGAVVNRTYSHDFNGNIRAVTQLDTLPRPVIYTGTDRYSYAAGKDLIASIDNGRSVIPYTHDANGNITADGMFSYSFNASNQLHKG